MNKQDLINELKPPANIVQGEPIPVPDSLKEWFEQVQKVLKSPPMEV